MIEYILAKLNIGLNDKVMHAMYGTIIYLMLLLVISPLQALIGITIIAVGKEVYDYFNSSIHTPDMYDALATIVVPLVLTIIII